VGVALPGLYNAHDDVVINSLKPYLRGIHIRKVLAESLHKPVIVENDANMAVHGHFAAHNYVETNLLLLNFTDGIGLGLILNGQPFYGTHGFAGEVGNILVSHPSQTQPFRFEDVCTLSSIIESFEQLQLIKKNNPIGSSIENLRTLIETDNTAQQILIYTGEIIGTALSTLVDLFNPHSIIIGGNIVVFKDILEPIIIKCVKKNSFIAEHADFAIRYESELSRFIAIGCNVKVIQQWLQTWIP
jgi:predicted NBD/HSP70 family sugar kinase